MLTTNQISDAFQSSLGRAPTDYEVKSYSTASPQTIAGLKDTYGKLNTSQSIVDYMKSIGSDPKTISDLATQHGITNIGTAEGNTALLQKLKSGQAPASPVIGGTVTPSAVQGDSLLAGMGAAKTPQQLIAERQTATASGAPSVDLQGNPLAGSLEPGAQPTVPGSISSAATPTTALVTDPTNPLSDATIAGQKDTYTTAQKAVADTTKQIADLQGVIDGELAAKRAQIAKSGGVVNEAQLRSEVLTERAPLLAQINALKAERSQAVSEQSIAGKEYQQSISDFYKSISAQQSQQKIDQTAQKMDVQQSQFDQKLEQSGWKSTKINITDAAGNVLGQKLVWSQNPSSTATDNAAQSTPSSSGTGAITSSGVTSVGNTAELPKVTLADGASPEQILQTLISGKPMPVKGIITPQSQQTLYNLAIEDMLGVPSSTGGRTPSALIPAVKDKETQIMNAYGLTPFDVAAAKADMKGMTAANTKLLQSAAFVKTYGRTAVDNLDLALQQSTKVPRGSAMFVNNYTNWAKGNFTPAGNLAEYETYIYTAAREYAKVTSGGAMSAAALTDSAQREASKLINAAQAPEVFAQVVGAMKKDMNNVIGNFDKSISSFPDSVKSLYGLASGATQLPRGSMDAATFVEKSLTRQGMSYDKIMSDMSANIPAGTQPALDSTTGAPVYATPEEIKNGDATPL